MPCFVAEAAMRLVQMWHTHVLVHSGIGAHNQLSYFKLTKSTERQVRGKLPEATGEWCESVGMARGPIVDIYAAA